MSTEYIVAPALSLSEPARQAIQQLVADGRILQAPADYEVPVLEFVLAAEPPAKLAATCYTLGSIALGPGRITPIRNRDDIMLLTINRMSLGA